MKPTTKAERDEWLRSPRPRSPLEGVAAAMARDRLIEDLELKSQILQDLVELESKVASDLIGRMRQIQDIREALVDYKTHRTCAEEWIYNTLAPLVEDT